MATTTDRGWGEDIRWSSTSSPVRLKPAPRVVDKTPALLAWLRPVEINWSWVDSNRVPRRLCFYTELVQSLPFSTQGLSILKSKMAGKHILSQKVENQNQMSVNPAPNMKLRRNFCLASFGFRCELQSSLGLFHLFVVVVRKLFVCCVSSWHHLQGTVLCACAYSCRDCVPVWGLGRHAGPGWLLGL